MGCDIHPYIEIDLRDEDGDIYTTVQVAKLYGGRDYLLFALLTDGEVRIPDAKCKGLEPKGYPERLSNSTAAKALHWIWEDSAEGRAVSPQTAKKWHLDWGCQFVYHSWDNKLEFYSENNHGPLRRRTPGS